MVKIRLKRTGKKHEPHFRVVITPARTKRNTRSLEEVGYYNPRTSPSTITLNIDRIKYWLSVGAQPSDTVRDMLIKEKLLPEYTAKQAPSKKSLKKKSDDDSEAKPAPKAESKKEDQPKKDEASVKTEVKEKKEEKPESKKEAKTEAKTDSKVKKKEKKEEKADSKVKKEKEDTSKKPKEELKQ